MIIFSYGSNMNSNRIKDRVKSINKIGVGKIEGYKLVFNKISKDGSGKANIMPSNNDVIWGVLYQIDQNDKGKLDKYEGVGYGYDSITKDVILLDNSIVKTYLYIATPEYTNNHLSPYNWYMNFIISGANENNLPDFYIKKLQSIIMILDQNKIRKIENERILKQTN